MSRRVAGRSKTSARKGKLFARQTVRLGWRKKKRLAMIDALRQAVLASQAGVVVGDGGEV